MNQAISDTGSQAKVLAIRLPLQDRTLLLPYSMVAEVASLSLRTQDGAFLGNTEWRGVRIPVFSLERACSQNVDIIAGRVRVAVLYGVSDPSKRPYYALVLAGMPRTETIISPQLSADAGTNEDNACAPLVRSALLGGEQVFIPNIQELESWMDSVEVH